MLRKSIFIARDMQHSLRFWGISCGKPLTWDRWAVTRRGTDGIGPAAGRHSRRALQGFVEPSLAFCGCAGLSSEMARCRKPSFLCIMHTLHIN